MKRILLVEDDRTIRRMYADCLRAEKFEVIEEDAAEGGLDRLLKGETFDLIITDIMMAKMDGWEFLQIVRKQLNLDDVKLPVIAISAFESAELEVKAFRNGANAYLSKPIVPLSKLTSLVRVLTGSVESRYRATEGAEEA